MRTLEELNHEIEECNRCICGLFRTMNALGVPEEQSAAILWFRHMLNALKQLKKKRNFF